MSNQDIIAKYRKRIIDARIASMEKKTGSHRILVNLPNGGMTTVELTEHKLNNWLISFETAVYDEKKRAAAEPDIIEHYQACVSNQCDRLSAFGNDFLNGLIKEMSSPALSGE
ncbi:hypothetical protein [Serratia sarumanii]|uniref:hypothetical protein n=1 Tax=Serratia sarumanii TaxID=3020826 RepID=UPI003F7D8737